MNGTNVEEIRQTMLAVIDELAQEGGTSLQSGAVLQRVAQRLSIRQREAEQALLTLWGDLFRLGYLAWGYNLSNANPPFFHLTARGREGLRAFGRDPANPDGYMAHLRQRGALGREALSYVEEALRAYNATCYRSAAIMIGVAAESLVLDLRDAMVARIGAEGKPVPKTFQDWKVKTVADALEAELKARKQHIERKLYEAIEAYWPALLQQVRASRNDAGHPASLEPITQDTAHASLLLFPELARIYDELKRWLAASP